MSPYRAVLFDFFGTLTEAVTRGPWHAVAAYHLGCAPAALTATLDRSFPLRATGMLGGPRATMRWVCEQLGIDPPAGRLHAAVRAKEAAVQADTRLRSDAVAVLRQVRASGLRTAVVSDCGHELPGFLPALPIAPLLDACVYSVEVGRCKPHPAMYRTACRWLEVDPSECLYVGDGGSRELTGARALGMTAVRLAAPDLAGHLVFETDAEFIGPRIGSLTELLRWLDAPVPAGRQPAAVTSPP